MQGADGGPRVPALDGIRGCAILFVIAFHAHAVFLNPSEIPAPLFRLLALGWSGVDLFFVLSGFLITGILLDSRGKPGFFRAFYKRRARRILPLYFAYLIVIFAVCQGAALVFGISNPWRHVSLIPYLTFSMNWMPGPGTDDQWLGHLWSLAVEEQFYLIWPAVVWFCPRRRLPWVCAALAVAALAIRGWPAMIGQTPDRLYGLTPARMDALAIGAFVAAGCRDFPEALRRWTRHILPFVIVAFTLAINLNTGVVWVDPMMRTAGASLFAILYGCAIVLALASPAGVLARLLSSRRLGAIGKYSYGMYVWHAAPFRAVAPMIQRMTGGPTPVALLLAIKYLFFPALVLFAYAAARVSYRFIEEPYLRGHQPLSVAGPLKRLGAAIATSIARA
jgi:peptidoglycan/LPS O-acetylase OafA/YrhL